MKDFPILLMVIVFLFFSPLITSAQTITPLESLAHKIFCTINTTLGNNTCTNPKNPAGGGGDILSNIQLPFIEQVSASQEKLPQLITQNITQPVIERTLHTQTTKIIETPYDHTTLKQNILTTFTNQIDSLRKEIYTTLDAQPTTNTTPYNDTALWKAIAQMNADSSSSSGSTNTDSQTLSLSSNTLAITGGNSVSLLPYLDNTDTLSGLSCGAGEIAKWNGTAWACSADASGAGGTDDQKIDTFTFSGDILSLSLEGDAEATKTVDLSSYAKDTDLTAYIASSTLNSEAELEAQLTDVTDIFTNNDTIDISDNTNLTADTEIVLTGDILSIASTIARDTELHDAVTLAGSLDYLTLVGQTITRNAIDLATDVTGILGITFGGTGTTTAPTTGQVLVGNATGGYNLVSESTLGTDTTLSEEQVEDFIGGMLGGTETGLTATYQDSTNDIDFEVTGVLQDLNTVGVPTTDGQFLVATGAGAFAYESGIAARTSLTLGNVENTALSTWAGTTNVTTLGTITAGVWNGTAVDVSDYTNLAAGTGIALTGDTLSATLGTSIDISDETNLTVSATGLELSADALALSTGYTIPLTASTTEWSTAYGWGDHASGGYLTAITGQSIKNLSDVFSTMTPADGEVLTFDTTNGWQAEAGGVASPLTTKGDLYTYDSANARLGVGTNGQVLVADSAETTGLRWADGSSGISPSFSVTKGSNQTNVGTSPTLITWSAEDFDTNNDFDLTTERFTPTVPGKYLLTASLYYSSLNSLDYGHALLYKNGSAIKRGLFRSNSGSAVAQTVNVSVIVDANGTTDYFEIYGDTNVGTETVAASSASFFSGSRIDGGNGLWTLDSPDINYTTGSVAIGTTTQATSSILTLESTTQGFLSPRMTTTQRDAIGSPATGLQIYNTTTNALNVYDGSSWGAIGGGGTTLLTGLTDTPAGYGTAGQVLASTGTTTQWSTLSGGISPSFSVHRSGIDQTITANVWAKIEFTNEKFDTNNNFDDSTNYRFQPTVSGKYLFNLSTACVAGTRCYAAIHKNGNQIAQNGTSGTANNIRPNTTKIVDMNGSTDYVEAYVFNDGGTSIYGFSYYTHFSGSRLGGNGASVLSELSDIDVSGVTNGQALVYNATTTKWEAGTAASSLLTDGGAATYLTSLTDDFAIGGTDTSSPFFFDTSAELLALTNTTSGLSFRVNDEASDATPFVIDASGNVGIGTVNPVGLLDISNTSGTADLRLIGSGANVIHKVISEYDINYTRTSGVAIIDFAAVSGDGTSESQYRFGINSGSTGDNKIVLFEPNGTTIQTIINSSGGDTYFSAQGGNVGIGTTTPTTKLTVYETSSNPQLRISYDATNFAEFTLGATGDLTLSAEGGDISFLDENLRVCAGGACGADSSTLAGNGNIVAENKVFAEGFEPASCPVGMIPVPASPQDGIQGFCIDKYEAKDVSGLATSQSAGTPWVSITQYSAREQCIRAGKHLTTEAEWLAVAHNIEDVGWNWDGGVAGTNQMSDGHSDNSPASALAASTDTGACSGTGQTCSDTVWDTQRRTYKLSNGEYIWDIGGNVWEWTDQLVRDNYPLANNWSAWTACSTSGDGRCGNTLTTNDQRYGGNTTSARGFLRGGPWNDGTQSGAFALVLADAPATSYTNFGFRCAR